MQDHKIDASLSTHRKNFKQWAMTPPLCYAVYVICLFVVAGLSFYAGTLKPKKAMGIGPPEHSAPGS